MGYDDRTCGYDAREKLSRPVDRVAVMPRWVGGRSTSWPLLKVASAPAALMVSLQGDAGVVFVAIGEHLVHVYLGPLLDAVHHVVE
jgi:hypothetical protein